MRQSELDQRIHQVLSGFKLHGPFSAGYPVNQDFDYSDLYPLLAFAANNIGDPFGHSRYQSNTHETEREVVRTIAELVRLPPDDAWGYVTAGGTEGNMYGIYVGRELLRNPIAYFSQDTHYSVIKILHVLNIRNIMIRSQDNGEMDYDDLRESIRINRDVPPLIVANIGTTMKGAVDDLERIRGHYRGTGPAALLHPCRRRVERDDSTLCGRPSALRIRQRYRQHRHLGPQADWLSITLRRGRHQAGVHRADWPRHRVRGRAGHHAARLAQRHHARDYLVLADQARTGGLPRDCGPDAGHRRIRGATVQRQRGSRLARTGTAPQWSSPAPRPYVLFQWQLAPLGDIAHLITMPHVTREMIDQVIADYLEWPRAET